MSECVCYLYQFEDKQHTTFSAEFESNKHKPSWSVLPPAQLCSQTYTYLGMHNRWDIFLDSLLHFIHPADEIFQNLFIYSLVAHDVSSTEKKNVFISAEKIGISVNHNIYIDNIKSNKSSKLKVLALKDALKFIWIFVSITFFLGEN